MSCTPQARSPLLTMISAAQMAADLSFAAAEMPDTVVVLAFRDPARAAFTVTDAIVGDIPLAEKGELDGIMDDLKCPIILKVASCPYKPERGQKLTARGITMRVKTVTDDPSGAAYTLDCEAV